MYKQGIERHKIGTSANPRDECRDEREIGSVDINRQSHKIAYTLHTRFMHVMD